MTGPRAPAGWYPDPSDTNVVRYWDGTAWTDLAAAPSQPLPVNQSTRAGSPPGEAAPVVRESTSAAWTRTGIALLVALVIIGVAVYATERSRGPDAPFGDQPAKVLKAGETFYEPGGSLHRVSKNPGKVKTRLVAVVLHPRDATLGAVPEVKM